MDVRLASTLALRMLSQNDWATRTRYRLRDTFGSIVFPELSRIARTPGKADTTEMGPIKIQI